MPHLKSDVTGFWIDNQSGTLTAISGSTNSLELAGGNALVDDTGLGDANHTEINDIGIVKRFTASGFINTTTYNIFGPLAAKGTSITKTVQALFLSGKYISGEASVGEVTLSVPIGLQTWSATFSSTAGSGFDTTSVALS